MEELIKVKDELYEAQKVIEHSRRQIDHLTAELIEFLKHKRIIETRIT